MGRVKRLNSKTNVKQKTNADLPFNPRILTTLAPYVDTTIGVSKNSSQLTTNVAGINVADRLFLSKGHTDRHSPLSVTAILQAGDIIRAHTDGSPNATGTTSDVAQFKIVKVDN